MTERDECRHCGQCMIGERDHTGRFLCYHCLREENGGEPLRLFAPVDVIPGQVAIGGVE